MNIKTVGIAGTGLIGAGWAARLLFRGYNVIAFDVSPTAEAKLKAQIKTAWPSLVALLGKPIKKGKLSFTTNLAEMASKSDFIHECAPEREDLKIKLFRDIDSAARAAITAAGFSANFSAVRGRVEPGRTDVMDIPRHQVEFHWPLHELLLWARGFRER